MSYIVADTETSYNDFAMRFTLTEQNLTRLATQNWEIFSERGYNAILNMKNEDIPENLIIPFSNFSIDSMIEIHEKQIEHANDVVQEQVI